MTKYRDPLLDKMTLERHTLQRIGNPIKHSSYRSKEAEHLYNMGENKHVSIAFDEPTVTYIAKRSYRVENLCGLETRYSFRKGCKTLVPMPAPSPLKTNVVQSQLHSIRTREVYYDHDEGAYETSIVEINKELKTTQTDDSNLPIMFEDIESES